MLKLEHNLHDTDRHSSLSFTGYRAAPVALGHFKFPTDHPVCCLSLFLAGRHQTEVGPVSREAKASIRTITVWLSLAPSSFTRCSIGSPCGLLSHASYEVAPGEQRAYHVPHLYPNGAGRAYMPVEQHLRQRTTQPSFLSTCLLASAYQPLTLDLVNDTYSTSLTLTLPFTPSSRPP
jgi:hypothetical protein